MIEWNSLHPVVVHFPIALLVVAPLFMLIGLRNTRNARTYAICALILMALGTVGAWVAVETGESDAQTLVLNEVQKKLLAEHQELGEATRTTFTALTVLYAVLILSPVVLGRTFSRRGGVVLGVIFLVIYAASLVLVVRTGDLGGRLVHRSGEHVHRTTG
jgi:uncharacterized membrane protein